MSSARNGAAQTRVVSKCLSTAVQALSLRKTVLVQVFPQKSRAVPCPNGDTAFRTLCVGPANMRHKLCILTTERICVFCVDLETNSDYLPTQHYLCGIYKQDGMCLLRGTN